MEVSKQFRSVASRSLDAQACVRHIWWNSKGTDDARLLAGRLEYHLDAIEIGQQLAREGRHRAAVADGGGVFEGAAHFGHRVESVAASFALDAMRDAADFSVVAAGDRVENRVDIGAFVRQKSRDQIDEIL